MKMVIVLARLNVVPGTSEQFLQTAGQLVEASCKEAGVIGYELLGEGENRFAFLERYKDADAAAAHLKTDHYRTLGRQLGQYIEGKPEVLKMTPTS
jgi:quinol monooxygenase YgiN